MLVLLGEEEIRRSRWKPTVTLSADIKGVMGSGVAIWHHALEHNSRLGGHIRVSARKGQNGTNKKSTKKIKKKSKKETVLEVQAEAVPVVSVENVLQSAQAVPMATAVEMVSPSRASELKFSPLKFSPVPRASELPSLRASELSSLLSLGSLPGWPFPFSALQVSPLFSPLPMSPIPIPPLSFSPATALHFG